MGTKKKMMYVSRNAPHGSIYAHEGLEAVLMAAAFEQHVCMAFIGDGVFQLMKQQDTSEIESKNFSVTFNALGDYDVTHLYVEEESLQERGLDLNDLMPITWADESQNWVEKPSVAAVSRQAMAHLMAEQDLMFNF
ncbi:MAG: tRNA 2-thiouridine synthesizing protein C [Parvicella sp.]